MRLKMRRKDLVEGEIYVTPYHQFARLEKKGLIYHKFSYESNGREWIEYHPAGWMVMPAGEYYNRIYGTYDEDIKD